MKKLKIIAISVVCLFASLSANAQIKKFYEKYSGKEGITKVFISQSMLSIAGDYTSDSGMKIGNTGKDIDIGKIMKKLDGLYVLTTENSSLAGDMNRDFDKLLSSYKLELLMEVDSDDENVKMYIERKGNIIKTFLMKALDSDGELSLIFFSGNIPEEDLLAAVKQAGAEK
ncbi:MAG: DUF4252 domain-containing protein [Bacteroidales bacterium]|jgi:hypothetical protein|nr:DUF4252 domain-containing protein [Bacteroidales bacterium]